MGSNGAGALLTASLPHAGHASSGSGRALRRRLGLGVRFFIFRIPVFVQRDDDAVVPEEDLHIQDHSGDAGLEQIHPFAGRLRGEPPDGVPSA